MKPNSKKNNHGLRTWLEIDKKLINHNYQEFRSVIGKNVKLMSVVKSNAYGHGLINFSEEVEKLGVDWLGVDSIMEGLALRTSGVKIPILVLGYTLPEMVNEAVKNDISITVSSFPALEELVKMNLPGSTKVHIKVDTGMNRQGFKENEMQKVIFHLKQLTIDHKQKKSKVKGQRSKVVVEGLYTHFASAKNPSFPKTTFGQVEIFEKWISAFEEAGFDPIKHACATGGTLLFPQAHFDMVRVGIGMYGLWPSKEVEASRKKEIDLRPILSWKTLIGEIKKLPKGSRLGYDLTEEMKRETMIAICPIGYWHGFPRTLSGIGEVIVKGKKARVLGRVSMDMIAIDITDIYGNSKSQKTNSKVKVGDEVTIIGKDGKEIVSADDLAKMTDTINYEIVTRINPLIKKIYI